MRQPITKNLIKNTPEGTDVFNMEWVHQGLAFVIGSDEENPGQAKDKDEAIEDKKGGEAWLSILFGWPIEPENLREGDKWDGAVTGIKENGKNESNQKKISPPIRLKVFDKKVESYHSEKHKHGIRTSVLRKADMVGHEGQREGTGKGDGRRKLSGKKVDHGNGKGSKD
jgi:hypothetical protein